MDGDPYPLPKLLQEINAWTTATGFPRQIRISWTLSQLETVVNYFSNYGVQSDFSLRMHRKLCLHEVWPNRFQPRNYKKIAQMVVSFFQELGELFVVPKLEQLSHMVKPLKKNQLVAGFLSFLLQLLQPDPHYDASSRFPFMEELRFLVTILGDTPFQATDHELVYSLLVEFEQVANEAGALVHSLVFSPDSLLRTMNGALNALSRHIHLLKDNIDNSLNLLSDIVVTPEENYVVASLFIVDSLLHDLDDIITRNDDSTVDVKDHTQRIHQVLKLSQSHLKDISMLQPLEIDELKVPVTQLRDVAYEAEYLINSYMVGDAPLGYLTGRLTHLIHKFESIGSMLQEAKKNRNIWAFEGRKGVSANLSLQPKNDSGMDDAIVGFADEEMQILDQLTGHTRELQIISISGLGGLGKTTLARKVFNNPLIRHHFDKSSWCVVSQTYQKKALLSNILMDLRNELGKATILNMDEESLSPQIYKTLYGRRYLIVLDDIWKPDAWDDLRRLFPENYNGSRLLFTSRDNNVAPLGSSMIELTLWSADQCWELLKRKIFGTLPCPEELQEIGKKIAANCYGMPLAVVVIAGLLSTMDVDINTWEQFQGDLESNMLPDIGDSLMQKLELSYSHLPQQLKPCFLYFGVFQEDAEISVKRLTHLWIAEGFILTEENEKAESVAEQYLMELINKNLVMVARRRSDGGVKACIIHDLLRDMCLRISENANFLKVSGHDSLIWNQNYQRMRVHINPSWQPSSGHLVPYGPCTRTAFVSLPDITLTLVNMKLLRVLYCGTRFQGLFGIEFLVHLRYLVLDHMVPSIDLLENLEFLIVNNSVDITSNLLKMAKLKLLRFQKAFLPKDCSVSEANNLEYLSSVVIHNPQDEELLRYSPHLRRLKCEYRPSWEEKGEYPCLDLHFLVQLESLTITAELSNRRVSDIVFPDSIKKLSLSGFCLPWEKMSTIGALPCLEVLKLRFYAFEGEIWDSNDQVFNQLKFLKLSHLNFSIWVVSSYEHFPRLQHLVLEDCFNLSEIPPEIGNIPTLQSIEVHGMCKKSLVPSATHILEELRDLGNDITLDIQDAESESDSDI